MRRLRWWVLVVLCVSGMVPFLAQAQTSAPAEGDEITLTTVGDWEGGLRSDLLVTNNSGGELRLEAGRSTGTFESGLLPGKFAFDGVGVRWKANVPKGSRLTIELRGGPSGAELGEWRSLGSTPVTVKNDPEVQATSAILVFPPTTAFLQFRVTMESTAQNASPELAELTLSYYPAPTNQVSGSALTRTPALSGAATLTPAPLLVARQAWAGNVAPPASIIRGQPRGIVLHQIGDESVTRPVPFLRALLRYQTERLGWEDLPYHYIIDQEGTIYEGRAGGPTSVVERLQGGNSAIHIALIGSAAPTGAALASLNGLLAWIGQAYAINPRGTYNAAVPDATQPVERQTISAYADLLGLTGSAAGPLPALMGIIRQATDAATVRARFYFAEGNVREYAERLAVTNPTSAEATVRFILLRQPGPAIIRETTVAARGRVDLVLNDVFNDTSDVPAIVESNAPVLAERYMDFGGDLTMSMGVQTPARVWYFAEGATDGNNRTFLVLFNPQRGPVDATITYIRDDGIAAVESVRVPSLQRRVVVVGDKLNGARFGARVVATQPIVAERTMIFGQGSSLAGQESEAASSGGVHTTPGVTELSRSWYFAEGTTDRPFEMSILVLNPNAQSVDAAVTFMTPDGTSLTRRYAIPATTRLAIPVNEVVPQLGVATTVVTSRPVAVERVMTWNNGLAGTAGPGATKPAFTWSFADGRTSGDFQQYVLISNPGKTQARVTVSYILPDGTQASDATFTMPAGSRQTVAVHQSRPGLQGLATIVRSTQPIVAERSLYRGDPRLATSKGGETVLGVPGDRP